MSIRFAIIVGLAAIARVGYAGEDGVAFFENEIRPILVEHCYECHSKAGKVKGGLLLDSRNGIDAGGDSGPVMVKGDPKASRMVEAIRYQNRELQMPPRNRLSKDAVAKIEKWIAMGAPDPREGKSDGSDKLQGLSVQEGRQFWSFRPVGRPTVPEADAAFVRNQVDAFILRKLNEKGLSPAPRADKRVLIRRVTQNLTGLPPTPREIEAFLADDSPNAFEQVVGRLLDSPHYGVRWGRHWLDVARYADSNGLDENIGFGNAWRYRDYVVDSFNADKPYDRFLIEQIAGDLLPDADQQTITATCFLQLGPKVMAEPDVEKLYLDVIDEQLDTLGKTFLGMTFGCVRCHDHKFDPLDRQDYYGLAAIFKSTRTFGEKRRGAIKYWYEHSVATEADIERVKKIDERLKELKSAASSFKSKQVVKLRGQARDKATDYLVAATKFEPGTPLSEVVKIAEPMGLHPRILHHCRMHLTYHREDPFFRDWHKLAAEGKVDELRSHYSNLFAEAVDAFMKARKKDPKIRTLPDQRLEAARAALFDNAGFLAVPKVDAFAFDEATLAEYHRLLSEARAFETAAPDEPSLMSVADGDVVPGMPIYIRGNHRNPGEVVERRLPKVMLWSDDEPAFSADSSGRLELARWIADPRHPLTARVMVNRIWRWHFGTGLVASTENFGVTGERPSHPELLDWLADYFVKSGWSVKAMHRLILNSATWQLASQHPDQAKFADVDSENRLLWRHSLRRLDAEQIRDSILAVSGRLDDTLGGKTLPLRNRQFVFNHTSEDHTTYDSLRRAIYLPVIRNNLYTLFEQFDFPDPTMPTGSRTQTVIAPQALLMMNDPLIIESAEVMARDVLEREATTDDRLREIYLRCYGRDPKTNELERGRLFIRKIIQSDRSHKSFGPKVTAWTLLCHGILAGNEFLYIK